MSDNFLSVSESVRERESPLIEQAAALAQPSLELVPAKPTIEREQMARHSEQNYELLCY
jgi:hypothetical protein